MKKIIIATNNQGKAKDFEKLLNPLGYEVKTLADYPALEEVEETGVTFAENAALKAETISQQLGVSVIADDSGLIVDALDGEPGVFSARYAGAEKDDQKNIEKVLLKLQGVPDDKRTARFHCTLALAEPGEETLLFTGEAEGYITAKPSGENGFGYDPIFYTEVYQKTFAELTADEKNQISHRANALRKLQSQFQ
ncbi:XTP/dITP diphosphatase [Jeotgalibacillus haloalkalitolerans]|uniref:dITP/XTP pyrophosphatase n=1 Tax=Jeotgalibacillus haloalkalitolerans TaxID=3104292 RepID=A0ABU5KM98_9BACL|nr:XTP/dITP diphosphatase [Jeotgalibacillus sp. HH7-29]MDZ5712392.1 XTP/dITP diphosphatase [Jeotgalibacillus sp. HH7-29]